MRRGTYLIDFLKTEEHHLIHLVDFLGPFFGLEDIMVVVVLLEDCKLFEVGL